jgi:hypothetical protein
VPSHHHERAAVQARRIVSGVQRIEQEFLVARHSVLSPRPNFQPERWLQGDPLQPPRRQNRRREPAGSVWLPMLVRSGDAKLGERAEHTEIFADELFRYQERQHQMIILAEVPAAAGTHRRLAIAQSERRDAGWVPRGPPRQEDMQQLRRTWEKIKAHFFEKPEAWVLFALLCVTADQWHAESSRLEDVCGLAREGIDITTPAPDDPEAALKQVERPSAANGYSLRELWRWQQLDGPKIEELCP